MAKSHKSSKKTYRHGNLREAILNASLRMIEKTGLCSLSIREIAKKAGVTHQAPYRHFKDRETLIVTLAEEGFEKLATSIANAVNSTNDPLEKLKLLSGSYMQWAQAHPAHFRMMFSKDVAKSESSKKLQEAQEKLLILTLQIVETAQKEDLIPPGDARFYARQIWAANHGVTSLFIDEQLKPIAGNLENGQGLAVELTLNLVRGFISCRSVRE